MKYIKGLSFELMNGIKKYLTLANIRRGYAVFFFTLFVLLLLLTDFRRLKGYETSLFLELSPLVSLSTLLTGWGVYKGLILSLFIVIPAIFFGRFFCSWVCPLGILNQWSARLLAKNRAVDDYRVNAYRGIFRLKYYILASLIVLALLGVLQVGLFDPIALLTRSFTVAIYPASNYFTGYLYIKQPMFVGGIFIGLVFLLILFANRYFTRLWCRVLCPLGALLGVLSTAVLFKVRRNVSKCTDCQRCMRNCHGGCDPHAYLKFHECHLCYNCIEDCPEGALHYGLADAHSSVQAPLDISRRRLIEIAAASVILYPVMRSSATASTVVSPDVIRPPGAIAEADFLRRCIKCGQCMRVCPTNVLQPALLEGGFEGLWTPILINRIGYCEHNCILCSHVCPTGALVPLNVERKIGRKPDIPPTKIGTAFYDRGRCLPWAMNTECIVCEEVCPTSPKAIWFQEVEVQLREGGVRVFKRPFVDTKLCVGCGICENKCPVRDKAAIRVTSIGESRSTTNRMMLRG
ncbi:MAG: 4Fe-4S binding protein [Magnetococcales bacterium]|nr:4Fe-4S binding protein [Nitrospirota bacterium]